LSEVKNVGVRSLKQSINTTVYVKMEKMFTFITCSSKFIERSLEFQVEYRSLWAETVKSEDTLDSPKTIKTDNNSGNVIEMVRYDRLLTESVKQHRD
jgi:hypothetical protein